jgi:quercetin dioxygenase-like cupin family protein
MEIRRFGIGHRRQDGPPGTRGVEATPLHVDARGVVAEVALKSNATIAPHSNPNLAYFLVIEGGGFVQVGDERARVAAGEAVVWPPDVVHSAWTEQTPMRAIVVEFAPAADDADPPLIDAGTIEPANGRPDAPAEAAAPAKSAAPAQPAVDSIRAEGELAPKPVVPPPDRESPEGEPW